MTSEKDIRFSQKKVDEAWKSQISQDKDSNPKPETPEQPSPAQEPSSPPPQDPNEAETSPSFMNLVTSLAYQVMMHLGEIPNPETQESDVNLEAAQEAIGLLTTLQEKTKGNLSAEESRALSSLLPELQMKYAQKA